MCYITKQRMSGKSIGYHTHGIIGQHVWSRVLETPPNMRSNFSHESIDSPNNYFAVPEYAVLVPFCALCCSACVVDYMYVCSSSSLAVVYSGRSRKLHWVVHTCSTGSKGVTPRKCFWKVGVSSELWIVQNVYNTRWTEIYTVVHKLLKHRPHTLTVLYVVYEWFGPQSITVLPVVNRHPIVKVHQCQAIQSCLAHCRPT